MLRFFICLFCLGMGVQVHAQTGSTPRVITVDWTIAETLVALGVPPVGVGDKTAYQRWVKEPQLPSSTVDLGSRAQPNIELIRDLKPDMMINSSWWSLQLKSDPSNAMQFKSLNLYPEEGVSWQQTLIGTKELGQLINKPQAAEALIQSTEQQFKQQQQQLAGFRDRPIAIVQFIDSRHLRIYGRNSLFDVVLQQLKLKNAWTAKTNTWGVNNIDLTQLAKLPPNTILVVVHPHPYTIYHQLQKSLLWQKLPFSQPSNTVVVPAVWSFGGLPAMRRFGNVLTLGLTRKQETPW